MLEKLKDLNSFEAFKYFKEINKIPRGSGNEKAISDWLSNFAKENNLKVIQDTSLNIIIKKPGTPGYENAPKVILQGHMDMVCEKNLDSKHDFLKDPIEFIVEGDILRANGTTLGADDGIAVAMSLAVLASSNISHPPIELLVTTGEEIGMVGAQALDPKDLDGRILINIDSEEEGKLLVSCAGGVREKIKLPIIWEEADKTATKALQVLFLIPNGVKSMSMDIEGLVQSSTNIGVLTTSEDYIVFDSAVRSSVASLKKEICDETIVLAEMVGATIEFESEYPEWQYDQNSKIKTIFENVYNDLFGTKPEIAAIHAGLECGLFSQKFGGNIDQISFGPNMYDVHTSKEHLSIASTERMWNYLLAALKEIK